MLNRSIRQALEEIEALTAIAGEAETLLITECMAQEDSDKHIQKTNYTPEELQRFINLLNFKVRLHSKAENPITSNDKKDKKMNALQNAWDATAAKCHGLIDALNQLKLNKSSTPPIEISDEFQLQWLDLAERPLDEAIQTILMEENANRKQEDETAAAKQPIDRAAKLIQELQKALVILINQSNEIKNKKNTTAQVAEMQQRELLQLGNDFYNDIYRNKKTLPNEDSKANLASFQKAIQENIDSIQASKIAELKPALSQAVEDLKAALLAYDAAVDAINRNKGTDFSIRATKLNDREIALQKLVAANTKITSSVEDTLKSLDASAQKEIEKELEAYTTVSSELTARIQQAKHEVADSQSLLEVEQSIATLLNEFSTELALKKSLTDYKTKVDELNERLNLLNEKLEELSQAAGKRPDSTFQTSFNKALSVIISSSDSLSSRIDLLRKQTALVELCNNAVSQFADANLNSKNKTEELTALNASWNAEFEKIDDLTRYIIENYCPENTAPEDFFRTDKSIHPDTYSAMESFKAEYTKAQASLADKISKLVDKNKLNSFIKAIDSAKKELLNIDKNTSAGNYEAQQKKFSEHHQRLEKLKKTLGNEYIIAASNTLAEYDKVFTNLQNKLDTFETADYKSELDKTNIALDNIIPADLKTAASIQAAMNSLGDLQTKLTKRYEKLSDNTKKSTLDSHGLTLKRIAVLTSDLDEANRNISAAKTPSAPPATPAEPAGVKVDPAVAASKERMEQAKILWYQVYFVKQNAAENVSSIYAEEIAKREEAYRAAEKEYMARTRISQGDKSQDINALITATNDAVKAAETEKSNRRTHVTQVAIAAETAAPGKITAKDQYDIFRKQLDSKYLSNIIINLKKLEEKAAVLAYSAYNSESIAKIELEAKQIEEDLQDLHTLLQNIQDFRKKKEANKKDKTINNYDSPPRWPSAKQIEHTMKDLERLGIAKKKLAAGAIDPQAQQHTTIFDKISDHVETAKSNYLNNAPQQYMQYQYRDHKHLASDSSQNLYDFKNKPGDRERLSSDIQKWIGSAPSTKTTGTQLNFSLGEKIDASGNFTVRLGRLQEKVKPPFLDRDQDQLKIALKEEISEDKTWYTQTLYAADIKQLTRIPKIDLWAMILNNFMVAAATGAGRDKHGNLDLRIPHMPKELYEYELDMKGLAVAYGYIQLNSFLTENERKPVEKRAKQIQNAAAKNPNSLPMTFAKAAEIEGATNVLASSTSTLPGRLRR